MQKNINIALVGRPAVGKSTMVDYLLYYKDMKQNKLYEFQPISSSKHITRYEFNLEQYKVTIFDQPGITPNDQFEWNNTLKELERQEGKMDFILFCVDYTNGFFTQFERLLLDRLKEQGYQIVIVATKHNFVLNETNEVTNLIPTYNELVHKSSQYGATVILGNTVHNSKHEQYMGEQLFELLDEYYFDGQSNLNVAIIGQSGVGKSALINYLFEETVANSASGKPVTKLGFHKYRKKLDNYNVQLFDSWGLELDKYETWFKELHTFLNKHSYKSEIKNWLHIAIYCLDATSNRIQDVDIEIIQRLQNEGLKVIVVLTKAAKISEETKQLLETQVEQSVVLQNLEVIFVNSKSESLGQFVLPQFGCDELLQHMNMNYIGLIKERLPQRIRHLLLEQLEEYYVYIKNSKKKSEAKKKAERYSKHFWDVDYKVIIKNEIEAAVGQIQLNKKLMESQTKFKFESGVDYVLKDVDGILIGLIAVPFVAIMSVLDLFTSKVDIAEEMFNTTLKEISLEKIQKITDQLLSDYVMS